MPPYVNTKSANERLHHLATNIPLNLKKFNEMYNSDTVDNGAEASWCLQMREDRLGENLGMLINEKCSAVMWNQFLRRNYVVLGDPDV